jgi:Predicted acetyltransferase
VRIKVWGVEELDINVKTILCTFKDLDKLTEMNKQLIDDEKSDNPMNLVELKERMKSFIERDYNAYFFVVADEVIGYALINISKDPPYLRQFFICREHRRKSYGKTAFEAILKELNADSIDIEVLSCNEIGKAFWSNLGFVERSIYMRCDKKHHNF